MNGDKNKKKSTRAGKAAGRTTAVVILSAILSAVSGLTAFGLISYSGYVIYDSIYTNQAAFSSWDLSGYRPSMDNEGEPSFDELQKVNSDTVGWIRIKGTNIDYPVVQGKDDLEYATKDVFGNNSLTGAIYLTAANTRDFTNSYNLIYGHHMDNGAMFGDIEKYENAEFFNTNRDGYLITTQGVYDINIFARINTDAYDGRIFSAGDKNASDFPDLLNYVKSLSVQWQNGADIGDITSRIRTYIGAREKNMAEYGRFTWSKLPQDALENGAQLLALSTCADSTTNGRQLLFATMKIRTDPLPADMLLEDTAVPRGVLGHGGGAYWGFINLLCIVICLILMVPGRKTKEKYRRFMGSYRQDAVPEDNEEDVKQPLNKRKRILLLIEILLVVLTVLIFLITENLRNRMTILDGWTPLMLMLTGIVIWLDIRLFAPESKERQIQEE